MPIREKRHRLSTDCYQGSICISFTLCIKDRNHLFKNPDVVNNFIDALRDTAEKFQCKIAAYCFMPDHLHIIVIGTKENINLLKFIKYYKQMTGFWMSKDQERVSWQKDFFDHIIRKDEALPDVVRYILDNPVRQGLVADWRDYPFQGSIVYRLDDVLEGLI